MNKNLIEIHNLSVGYQTTKVLDAVNMEIGVNDFIGVIGPNGGGKTTLIKTILGLLPYWEGKISYQISQSKIGYLPQINLIDKEFPITVFDVILSGLAGKKGLWQSFSKDDRLFAEELLHQAGISHIKNKAIGQLSGGQMQRVLLCRALMNHPELLILDEPSTFVDNQFESELFEWLKKLNETIAILMVSHDLGTISSHVKTIACVNRQLNYHRSNKITEEQLAHYNCPIQIISHGHVPHQVLATHKQ